VCARQNIIFARDNDHGDFPTIVANQSKTNEEADRSSLKDVMNALSAIDAPRTYDAGGPAPKFPS
jgi:hypothetical protein